LLASGPLRSPLMCGRRRAGDARPSHRTVAGRCDSLKTEQ
jgi:hypothetical protein